MTFVRGCGTSGPPDMPGRPSARFPAPLQDNLQPPIFALDASRREKRVDKLLPVTGGLYPGASCLILGGSVLTGERWLALALRRDVKYGQVPCNRLERACARRARSLDPDHLCPPTTGRVTTTHQKELASGVLSPSFVEELRSPSLSNLPFRCFVSLPDHGESSARRPTRSRPAGLARA
jgi:hypothetical protein